MEMILMEETLIDYLVKLGSAGVLGYVVYWLLTQGKHTLDKQADANNHLADSITQLSTAISVQNNKLEKIENKLDKLHDDIKDLKHEIGG